MKLKLRYKFMIVLVLILSLLFVYYYIRINSVIRQNYKRYLSGQIMRAGEIVDNSMRNLRKNKQQSIRSFANIPELDNAVENSLISKIPFILKKHLNDYQFDTIQIYSTSGHFLGEAGLHFAYEQRKTIRSLVKEKYSSGIYVRKGRIVIVASALTPNSKAVIVGKFIVETHAAQQIKDIVGLDIAFLKKGEILSTTITPNRSASYLKLSEWKNNSNIIQNSLLGQKGTQFYPKDHLLVLYQPLKNHTQKIFASTLIVMKSDLLTYTEKDSKRALINILIGGLLIAIFVSFIFASQITKHLNQITKWALNIQKDNLDKPVSIQSHDEIGDLADVINRMMLTLKKSFDQIHDQNEQLKYLNKVKSDFIMTISHEMRTPITTLYGSIEILKDGDVDQQDQIQIFYRSMFTNINLLKKMVNNFIMFSNADSHIPKLKPISIKTFIAQFKKNELDEELKDQIEKLHLNIEISLPQKNIQILSDKDFFHALFYELVHNAIIYNKENGTIKITFQIQQEYELILILEDTGIGIPDKVKNRIFERFYRGIDYRKFSIPGVGLGLSLASLICEKLGLSIDIESRENQFTKVTVGHILCQSSEERPPS